MVRDPLRVLEERKLRMQVLKAHLAEGADQAARGEFVEGFSMDDVIAELDEEADGDLPGNATGG